MPGEHVVVEKEVETGELPQDNSVGKELIEEVDPEDILPSIY